LKPLGKNIIRLITGKEIILMASMLILTAAVFGFYSNMQKDVKISDNGVVTEVRTIAKTVGDVLEQNNITVASSDYISMPLDAELQRETVNEIDIKRAVPVKIIADGDEMILMAYGDTVGEALEASPIKPGELDKLDGVNTEDKIIKNMTIKIVRVEEKLVSEKEQIPYDTEKRKNSSLSKGVEKVAQKGVNGELEKEYKLVIEDGREVSKELLKETILSKPVNAIIEVGTLVKNTPAVRAISRGESIDRGDFTYVDVLDMRATAYTASYKCTGKRPGDPGFGITCSGMKARKGVIAVDPRVIPLGTKLYIEIEGSTPDYGFAIAGDTGGAIKGNKIDLYYDSQDYVDKFGVKKVKVYILED
jgi:uncharacterized protein YabE (DUF348 family)/3D (Asp-Asp-Asp) domain-containing protein